MARSEQIEFALANREYEHDLFWRDSGRWPERRHRRFVDRVGKDQNTAVSFQTRRRHGHDMTPDMVPDINICSFNNSTENNSRKNTAPLSRESGDVDLVKKEKPKKLDRSQFTNEELAFIDLYHRICLRAGLGFLPVTQRSEELDKVLDTFAPDFDEKEWTENFREAVKQRHEVFRTNPRKYNTLVQICWKLNY